MHHTDYSINLRQAQHKTPKNVSLNALRRTGDVRSAILAVLLVLIALFQMDPANAQSAPENSGFGSLEFGFTEQPFWAHSAVAKKTTVAKALDSSLKLFVYNDTLTLIVDQTFNNPTTQRRAGEYVFAVPIDAVVHEGQFTVTDNAQWVTPNSEFLGSYETQAYSWTALHSERSGSTLRITTPPISTTQSLHVYLNIEYPSNQGDSLMWPLMPYSDDFNDEDINSVSAAVNAMIATL